MGVSITELLTRKEIDIDTLSNKKIAVDTPMWLYQFLSSIRQSDGSYLTDENGNPTSHLVGLSSRIPRLLEKNVRLAFVFDGKPPELKAREIEKRKKVKAEAQKKYHEAQDADDLEAMKKYALQTTKVSREMIEEAKEIISAFGMPVIQAPSEAEAQGAHMVKNGDAYALATNDADALMFKAPLIIRNLNLVGKRRVAGKAQYSIINPETVSLRENLEGLGVTIEQLTALCMLVGTDFNPGGIKGIGPKKALKIVKEYNSPERIFAAAEWEKHFGISWQEVYKVITEIPVTDDYCLKWGQINNEKIRELLVEKHSFSAERVEAMLEKLSKAGVTSQRSLADFGR